MAAKNFANSAERYKDQLERINKLKTPREKLFDFFLSKVNTRNIKNVEGVAYLYLNSFYLFWFFGAITNFI